MSLLRSLIPAALMLLAGCGNPGRASPATREDAGEPPDLRPPPAARLDGGADLDADGDHYTPAGGDCDDHNPAVNPGAWEVPANGIDDNCDGQIDEPPVPCDARFAAGSPEALAGAIELCSPWPISAALNNDGDPRARAVKAGFGTFYRPHAGRNLAMLSTGLAMDKDDAARAGGGFVEPQTGTPFGNDDPNPLPMPGNGAACGLVGDDEPTVHDQVELRLRLRVPTNVHGLAFDFAFVSAEYPEFVGTAYNDKFLALLTSRAVAGGRESNVSFDQRQHPITVNAGFFRVCQSAPICMDGRLNACTESVAQLAGTGMEDPDQSGRPMGGGTGWLTTETPLLPGETITLRLLLFDEGDHLYDSSVVIDNLRWKLQPPAGGGGPVTHP